VRTRREPPVGGRTTDLDPGLGRSLPALDDLFARGRSSALWRRVSAPSIVLSSFVLSSRNGFSRFLMGIFGVGLPLSGDEHITEVRLAEVRLVETGPTEAASTEVGSTKIYAAQMGSVELRADQIGVSEARLSEVSS